VIAAVAHVSREGRAGDVVNLSLGGEGTSALLDRKVRAAAEKGILFAIAAGNETRAASAGSPARVNHPNVFTVSAMDSTDTFARFSNFGNDAVDYCAPGVRILSAFQGGRYAVMSGTSMAAPHLAGLLLLKDRNLATVGYVRNDPDGTPDLIVGL
jgi:subtilisin family serine protease